mmetsp:Transcript_21850/g.32513  ORF Transcript_21850/g.32513 Transcript_21850/m.32513 type:complete len:409 (-) Transcript_21850:2794-4020(-)
MSTDKCHNVPILLINRDGGCWIGRYRTGLFVRLLLEGVSQSTHKGERPQVPYQHIASGASSHNSTKYSTNVNAGNLATFVSTQGCSQIQIFLVQSPNPHSRIDTSRRHVHAIGRCLGNTNRSSMKTIMNTQHLVQISMSCCRYCNMNTNAIVGSAETNISLLWYNQGTRPTNTHQLALDQEQITDRCINLTTHTHLAWLRHRWSQMDTLWGSNDTKWRSQGHQIRQGSKINVFSLECIQNRFLYKWLSFNHFWCLSKVLCRLDSSFSSHGIVKLVQINHSFIRVPGEQVESRYGFSAHLLAPKYQVDPVIEILAHIVAFQSLSVDTNEPLWRSLGPRRQRHVIDRLSHLCDAKIKAVAILEEFGKVKELGNEFSNILLVLCTRRSPTASDIVKQSIGHIKSSSLKAQC